MLLDTRTLIIVVIFLSVLMAVGMALFGAASQNFRGYRCWVVFNVLTAVSMVLITLRGVIPDFFSVILANDLVMGIFVAVYEGTARFVGQPSRRIRWGFGLGMAVTTAVLVFFTYREPSVRARTITMSLFAFASSLCCVDPLLRERNREMRLASRMTLASLLIYGVFSLFRAGWVWAHEDVADYLQGNFAYNSIFLVTIFNQVTIQFGLIWMATKRLELELNHRARTDPLTGTANRRGLYELWPRECAQADRNGWPVSIVIMDIDHFKKLNDQFGHQAGDEVLRESARIWRETLRGTDLLVRMGGEEFMAVLPNTHKTRAFAIAERLRRNLETADIRCSGQAVKVTASFGVSTRSEDGGDLDSLISAADRAMYEGKRIGRNRVVLASPILGTRPANSESY
jgi:diguanylate cyclase (GGDEF)-like protein